jgi:hypothetical protein
MKAFRPHGRFTIGATVASLGLVLASSPVAFGTVINGGFEEPSFTGIMSFFPTIPGWNTTEPVFELWNSGFLGVPAPEGNQFAELNAWTYGTYSQTIPAIGTGEQIGFQFAHRGREGAEVMRFTLTDLGANGAVGGGDDTVLFSKDYTDALEWGFHYASSEDPILALGNPVEITYESVFTVGGDGKGNFLDAVDVGPGVGTNVPEGGSTLAFILIGATAVAGFARRRSHAG